MVQLIVGEKGKGKTKILLDKVNEASKEVKGNIVFLDKNTDHMYDLKNSIRLVNTSDYAIKTGSEFIGFVSGIIAADHDLEQIYIDGLLRVAAVQGDEIFETLYKLDKISEAFKVVMTISISVAESALPDDLKKKVVAAL